MRFFEITSYRERNIWATLVFDIAISAYYFITISKLPEGVTIDSPEMGIIIINVIRYSVIAAIIIAIILRNSKKEIMDERDYQIDAKANAFAYTILLFAVAILIGFVAVNGSHFNSSILGSHEISAMLLANLLLFALFISTAAKAMMQLLQYRRT